jgi:hypothetical protein
VIGNDGHTVNVELDENGDILYSDSDCPYDLGPYCKHETAVFYALRDMLKASDDAHNALKAFKDSMNQRSPGKLMEPSSETLEDLLLKQHKEKLVNFITSLAKEREEIALRLRLEFNTSNYKENLKDCTDLIRSTIRQYRDRQGFLSYSNTYDALEGARRVIEMGKEVADRGDYPRAVDLYLCVIHEAVPLLQSTDDSAGFIGDVINHCLSSIDVIVENNLDKNVSKEIFKKLLKESTRKIYDGWMDWRISLIGSCIPLAVTQNERMAL